MKKIALLLGCMLAGLMVVRAQVRLTGTWQAEVQPNVFWNVELRVDGTSLAGGVGPGGGDLVAIEDGMVKGNTVVFKVRSPDGDRTITFTGTVTGNDIAFTRDVVVRQGGNQGGNGIFGAPAARQFTVRRVPDGQVPSRPRGGPFPRQLTVFDRQGKVLGTVGKPGAYNQPVLSPDGTRIAVVQDGTIWVYDMATGARTQISTGPGNAPVWSPDGTYVGYASFRNNNGGLYRRVSTGTGSEELLYRHTPAAGMVLTDWSADGRFLSFSSGDVLFSVPVQGERKAIELAREEFSVQAGRFSPDSRFLAYRSDESGQFEVIVRSFDPSTGFPPSGGKWQVSKGGVGMVHWRRDGRELYYLAADGGVMAVEVNTTPTFKPGASKMLFRAPSSIPLGGTPGALGSVSRDGQRVVFAVPMPPERKEVTVAPEILSNYTGTYVLFGMESVVTLEGNQLVIKGFGDNPRMFATSETSFFFKDASSEIDFVKDEKGRVTHFMFYQGGPAARAMRK